MARGVEVKRTARKAISAEEAEKLFETVDETGHANAGKAQAQHSHRLKTGESIGIDPLSGEDPSGANTDRIITRSAIIFVSFFLVLVVFIQVGWGYVRRVTTTTLAENASRYTVVSALNMGVEWGGGFTQFPSEFTVQEADEHTHRIEITVTDSASSSELEAFATAQVQASALSVNALLNPNIDTVTYHVRVRRDASGHFQKSTFFGFLRPTGAATPFMTFVWTKTTAEDGVRFDCSITGVDSETQERLRKVITSKSTPAAIINYVIGDNGAAVAENVLNAVEDDEAIAEQVNAMLDAVAQAAAQATEAAEGAATTLNEPTPSTGEATDASQAATAEQGV